MVGRGCYSDDVNFPGETHACFVRSPHAHARIERIETAAARATPGVIAVLTGVDAAVDGVKPVPQHIEMPLTSERVWQAIQSGRRSSWPS
ncbi:MAG TPA: hypothetical protein VMI34_06485 [Candidatus Bathyarchaeia archaeon]|nr:hypothetical protein [Candidatus Bathyarchaeia archaeon]